MPLWHGLKSFRLKNNFPFFIWTATALRTFGKNQGSKKCEITRTQKQTGPNDEYGRCETIQKENGKWCLKHSVLGSVLTYLIFQFYQKVQIKVKKQHDDELLDDGETQVYIANDDGDSMQTNQDLYVIEPIDGIAESDGDEYVEFELDGSKCEDRGSGDVSGGVASMDEINDENSLLTAPEFEYVSHRSTKPSAKRLRESTVVTPHEFTTSTTYKRLSGGGGIDRSLIDFQKKLMQAEFDHKKKLRDEKHQLEVAELEHQKKLRDEKHQMEMAILKADLTNKTLEHQKQMELMNEKLQD